MIWLLFKKKVSLFKTLLILFCFIEFLFCKEKVKLVMVIIKVIEMITTKDLKRAVCLLSRESVAAFNIYIS
jgi:hypothetical protein